MTWALVPAAGSGRRFGGGVPKQYLQAAGKPLIAHALEALLAHPQVDVAVVALAAVISASLAQLPNASPKMYPGLLLPAGWKYDREPVEPYPTDPREPQTA